MEDLSTQISYLFKERQLHRRIIEEGLAPLYWLYTLAELKQFLDDEATLPQKRATLKFNHEINPSEIDWLYWCVAQRDIKQMCELNVYPEHTRNGGKWLIFVPQDKVDDVWRTIRRATIEGELGSQSKVSTRREIDSGKFDSHVICVYTYSYKDEADTFRIREVIRKLLKQHGIYGKIRYKTDRTTEEENRKYVYFI